MARSSALAVCLPEDVVFGLARAALRPPARRLGFVLWNHLFRRGVVVRLER